MIQVLRLGHRRGRDNRISTHVGLTARQWGAEKITYSGESDSNMVESVEDIVSRWGGDFEAEFENDYEKIIREFDGLKVHLTMYGEKINQKMDEVGKKFNDEDLLVIVGAEKVPRKVYKMADYNISVGNQPHSEIAALAVFMDRIRDGEIKEEFNDAEIEVKPSKDQKLTQKYL